VIFFNILSVPGTPVSARYYAELEEWFYANYPSYAGVRVEWSKGWAYTEAGAYTNDLTLGARIPASFTQGMAQDAGFRAAVDMLDAMDPHRVFSTKFLDRLMPRSADLNGDGSVGAPDLATMLSAWGSQRGPADLDNSGGVDGGDLADLLGRWTTK
jgi:hypothetical protein